MDPLDPQLPKIADCLYRLSVKALIIKDGKILLVKEQDDEFWSLPGGGIDYDETANEALIRELGEELGVPAKSVQTDFKVTAVQTGFILEGIPQANLFYHVTIPPKAIRSTAHVLEHRWYAPNEIADLYLSPSTGGAKELLRVLEEQTWPNML